MTSVRATSFLAICCVIGAALGATSSHAVQCTKDVDCRGDRICSQGVCQDQARNAELKVACGLVRPGRVNVILGLSTTEAKTVLKRIGDAAGLENLPLVVSGDVPHAQAMLRGAERIIVYNPSFVDQLAAATGTDWSKMFVLAHELGHHAQGHTLYEVCNVDFEFQADGFAARTMKRMGASLAETTAAMKGLSGGNGDCHPATRERIDYLTAAYQKEPVTTDRRRPKPVPEREIEITEDEPEPKPLPGDRRPPRRGHPSGYGTVQCGCWGYMIAGDTRPNAACDSGYDIALPCPGWCPMGGAPWGRRCQ